MPNKPLRTPQDKKALSYAKDCRNVYGENDKASRKTIPARKAGESRRVRRKAVQSLGIIDKIDETGAEVIESSLRHDIERVGGWVKGADLPLGQFVEREAKRRATRENRRSPEHRQ